MPLIDSDKKNRFKEETLDEIKRQDIMQIRNIMSLANVGEYYCMTLEDMHTEALDQFGKACAVGRILQDMLKMYMPAAEIRKELDRRMLEVEVPLGYKAQD